MKNKKETKEKKNYIFKQLSGFGHKKNMREWMGNGGISTSQLDLSLLNSDGFSHFFLLMFRSYISFIKHIRNPKRTADC